MTAPERSARQMRAHAQRAAHGLGRAGLAARGILYVLMGTVALLAAANLQNARGPKGTLAALITYPAGRAVVFVLALGFAAFALAHLLTLFTERGLRWSDWWRRVVAFFLLCTYASLTWFALHLALYQQHDDEHAAIRNQVGWLLAWPGGRIALAMIAMGIGGFGGFELWHSVAGSPTQQLPGARFFVRALWRFGVATRGALFLGVALVLARVAFNNDPREAGGIGTALRTLAGYPAARPILLAIGLGLVTFGVVEALAARRGSGGQVVERAAQSAPAHA
jgi:hypothetical protein